MEAGCGCSSSPPPSTLSTGRTSLSTARSAIPTSDAQRVRSTGIASSRWACGYTFRMKLPPFLLDQWLAQKGSANPPIEYDLGSSTGPVWTLRELMALAGDGTMEQLLDTSIF